MKAEIPKEDDEYVKVYVTDNDGVKHDITIEKSSGEVVYHDKGDYPDVENRTEYQHGMVSFAKNYAKYYVSQQTDHGPYGHYSRIEGLEAVRETIAALSDEEFETYFEDAWRQVIGKHPDVEYPVELPSALDSGEFFLSVVDVYLDDEGQLEAVSDIHIIYYDEQENQHEQRNEDPFEDREPDATLQLVQQPILSLSIFQEYLDYHLRCQIRDCYHEMGLEPPEEYRVLGYGDHDVGNRYRNDDITQYDHYYDKSADIPGYKLDFDYGLGVIGKAAMKEENPADNEIQNADLDVDLQTFFDPDGDGGLLDAFSSIISGEEIEQSEESEEQAGQ